MPKRRAVFTGLGVLTSIGTDPGAFWQALLDGKCGIGPIKAFDPSALTSRIAAEVQNFDAKAFIPASMKSVRKSLKVMARTIQLGVAAAQQAMEPRGPKKGEIDPFRFGVEFACVMVATELEDLSKGAQTSCDGAPPKVNLNTWGEKGLAQVPPLWMLKYLPNMPACHVSVNYDAQGPNNTITNTDVAGLLALGEAFRLMGRDCADYFLVGACDSKINPVSFTRHSLFHELSKRNDTPGEALRPYDRTRDGSVLGEGAAVFGLEELEFAQKRGATIDAELLGFASGFDKGKLGSRFAGVIRSALKEAEIAPVDVDHVNAAASGSVELDAWEARAIAEVFGSETPVFAPKGHLGDTGAASGLIELAASVLALQHGQLPGTVNYRTLDPACPINVHSGVAHAVTKPYIVKTSFTERGQCAAVVVKKWK